MSRKRKLTPNPDAVAALAAARRGACVGAARHLDRARRLDLYPDTSNTALRSVGLVVRQHCKTNKAVKAATWGWLRGAGRR